MSTGSLRISTQLNMHCCSKNDMVNYVKRGVDFNKAAGFDAIDFSMNYMLPMGDDWERGMTEVTEYAAKNGMRFELCHLPFGVKDDSDKEKFDRFCRNVKRSIEAAKLIGADYAVIHPNTTTCPLSEFDRDAEYKSVMGHLTPFAEHAAKFGVNMVVENMRLVPGDVPVHRYCGDPEELIEIADALGLGICWDFGHAHICGLTQSEALRKVGSRLRMLHVNDNFAYGDDHIPPFCGSVDWKDAMTGLAEIGYSGLFNFEVSTGKQPEGTRRPFAEFLLEGAHAMIKMFDDAKAALKKE